VAGHVAANRALVAERLAAVRAALAGGPLSAYDLARRVYGEAFAEPSVTRLLTKTLCWLAHLEAAGEAARLEPDSAGGEGVAQLWARADS
jgi:hypothetical protein